MRPPHGGFDVFRGAPPPRMAPMVQAAHLLPQPRLPPPMRPPRGMPLPRPPRGQPPLRGFYR